MKITFSNKTYLNQNADIPENQKLTDANVNEIKNVVNSNDNDTNQNTTSIGNLNNLNTTNKNNLVEALNEVNNPIIAQNRVNSVDYALKNSDYLPFTKENFNNSNGKIVFNSNGTVTINHTGLIKISVLIWINGNSNQRPWTKITNITNNVDITGCIADIGDNGYVTHTISNIYANVSNGDNLGVKIGLNSGSFVSINKYSGDYISYMNIEIIK